MQDEIFGPVLVVLPFDTDDEGMRPGQRHAVRPGRLRLDPRRLPGPARHPRDPGRLRLDQRPHPDHQRDAARRLQGLRLRQGHVAPTPSRSTRNVKHVMYDITGVARKDWHRTVFGDRTRRHRPDRPSPQRNPTYRALDRHSPPGHRPRRCPARRSCRACSACRRGAAVGGAAAARRLRHPGRRRRPGRGTSADTHAGPLRHREGRQLLQLAASTSTSTTRRKKRPDPGRVHRRRPASRSTTPRTSTTTTSSSPRSSRSSPPARTPAAT